MPPEEIRAVLTPGDPVISRRLLELHRERLAEWAEEQRRLLSQLERAISAQSAERSRAVAVRASAAICSARR
jgi:hypothetical protein